MEEMIQKDLVSGSGDQLLTLDTETNLEWLNLTATANRSANEVLGGFGRFATTHGFDTQPAQTSERCMPMPESPRI
jgi:hypothetical protein